jgi:hypothetical protein
MQSMFRKLRIQALKAKLELCQHQCASLAAEFETATSSGDKAAIAQRWDRALKENHAIQFKLATLEKLEKEKEAEPGVSSRTG